MASIGGVASGMRSAVYTGMSTKTVTYTHLRDGSWGLRGPAGQLRPGIATTVAKKSGERKTEAVGWILWTGDGLALAAIGRSQTQPRYVDSYRAGITAPHGRTCPMCGSRECARAWDPRDLCSED
jgi:hypothetical protein